MFVIPPLGLCFSVRKRDQAHAWDPEPETWARNLRFEDHLDQVLPGEPHMEPPRHGKSDDDMNPWIKIALQVGVPAVIALFLVQQMAWKFDAKLDANTEMMRSHTVMSTSAVSSVFDRLDRADRTQGVMIDLLRAQCVNAAKTNQERSLCLSAGASR